ncbi:hypothetical protein O6H91_18G029300 [Diphasiastrum complanatum]|uniref:Uncharacterized protein n=1 Tax=Diphasiastrum complanatum TaxID=34168 RepID=A0ACC2AZA3_DIPCM|nr:hypothetical protein O6H91_Y018100 [Diphasiastrum complanatum]KAJ7522851.1 hypothetical protein O6H91_18G029300 [Diphasiastrum complanatum]
MQENMERVPRVITLVFAVIALVLLAADEGTESIEVSLPGMSKFTYLTKSECFVDIEGLKFYLDSLSVVAIAYLLASAAAVSTGIAYLSKHGAPKVGWNEVCTEFNHLCKVHVISLINAYLAALAIFASAAISAYHVFGLYAPVMPDRETQRELDI